MDNIFLKFNKSLQLDVNNNTKNNNKHERNKIGLTIFSVDLKL